MFLIGHSNTIELEHHRMGTPLNTLVPHKNTKNMTTSDKEYTTGLLTVHIWSLDAPDLFDECVQLL
jgi:hypothetical protein